MANEICKPLPPLPPPSPRPQCLSCCLYSGDISEPVAKQIRAFVGGARTTRSNTEAQGAQWTFAERMEGGRGEGEKGRETDTVYPLRSSAASMPVHAKNLQPRQWRPRGNETRPARVVFWRRSRGWRRKLNQRLKYNRSVKYVWAHGEIYANVSAYLCALL